MTRPVETNAEGFQNLDFHDYTFVAASIQPPRQRNAGMESAVEIRLLQYCEKRTQFIRFSGCTNIRVAMDFDILAGNLPPNTSGVTASTDSNRISEFMQSQKKDWGVRYAGTCPLIEKFAAIDDLVLFQVQFFGGIVEVVARQYHVETVDKG